MRRVVRFVSLSLLGIVTTLAAYMVGLVVMPATALSADVPAVATAQLGSQCVVAGDYAALHEPLVLLRTPSSSASRRHGNGDVRAAVTRAVFVRVVGHDLVVTTNTGSAPRRDDTYYYVRDGHAGLAVPRVAAVVRSACAGLDRG